MPSTPNMNLTLPAVGVTLGPEWATEVNLAFTDVDAHDHSPGKGVALTQDSISITDDLDIGGHNLTDAKSVLLNEAGALTGSREVYVKSGDLFYNNSSGIPVRLTVGPSIANPGITGSNSYSGAQITSTTTTLLASTTSSYYEVNSTTQKLVKLPSAASMNPYQFLTFVPYPATNDFYLVLSGSGTDTINSVSAYSASCPITVVSRGAAGGWDTIGGTAQIATTVESPLELARADDYAGDQWQYAPHTWVQNGTSNSRNLYFYLPLSVGSRITAASISCRAGYGGNTHSAMPASKPFIYLLEIDSLGLPSTIESTSDTSATTGSYDIPHSITMTLTSSYKTLTGKRYLVKVQGEGGANSVNSSFAVTYVTVTKTGP